jgi:5-methylthioadenosine/S-adenosylhomocysteine deaminase
MNIHIKNATILTMDDDNIVKGELVVQNNTIVFVGKKYTGNVKFDRVIDAKGNIIMPGFVNAHTHTAMSILKNTSDSKNLQDWLFEDILPKEKHLTKEKVYWASMLGILEYVKNGITSFCDAYYYPNETIKAVEKSGIRARICLGYHPEDLRTKEELEQEYLTLKKTQNERVSFMWYAHSIYTVDEGQFSNLIALSKKYNLPVYTHMSETLEEVSDCVAKYDITPTKLLEELGFFDVPCSVAHGVHLDKEDIQILANYNVNVVSNPASNLKLGSGIAPLYSLDKMGVNLALGTDGACSNNALDMFREMYLASTLSKAQLKDASVMPAKKILQMATTGGANAMFYDTLGKIKEGYLADLIMIDVHMPNLTPLNEVESAVVYSAGVQNVVLTMVNGNILYENGKFNLGESIDLILKNNSKSL